MANARKCDRCGKFYDPFHMEGMTCRFKNPMFQNSNDIAEGLIGKLMMNTSPDAYVDLCPGCAELFETFMCMGEPSMKDPGADTDGDSETPLSDLIGKIFEGKLKIPKPPDPPIWWGDNEEVQPDE